MPADQIVVSLDQEVDRLVFLIKVVGPSVQCVEFLKNGLLRRS